jgi:predicted nucleic acid-binding protein
VAKPTVVANAGPLIYLALLDHFHLLQAVFHEVGVPEAVY